GMENTVAAAALGIKRGGPAWVPNLDGAPRIQKPPLATWIMVAGLNRYTVEALNDPDAFRAGGPYDRLAWEMRYPALLAGCLMVLAAFGLGRVAGGDQLGILSACVCGTGLLFLQQTRYATTDIHLALWVVTANFFSALALLKGQRWVG